ncbi:hypothetical protein [Algibacter sp. 2305UL17-15]|uniref:hypothetical protein n=1 Tax=Algibacter sp. 2305UL17-15 TaxID=3231268 RepID=UPI00345AE077
MKLIESEIIAIGIIEAFYNKNRKGFLKKLFSKRFKFNTNEIPNPRNLVEFWNIYGLKNTKELSFTKEEKLECISKCYTILYNDNFNLKDDYNQKLNKFNTDARKAIKNNPGVHFNWNIPSPEKYLNENRDKFQNYS